MYWTELDVWKKAHELKVNPDRLPKSTCNFYIHQEGQLKKANITYY